MEIKLIQRLFLVLLLFAALPVSGQISFYKVFAGNGYDRGEGACQLPDSSYLVTGSSSSFEEAPSQAFLMHIDSNGTFLWSHAYGGTESEEGKRVMAVPDFGYYIAGTSSSSGSEDFDNYLIFTDTGGNKLWEVFTDNGGWERIHDAELLADTSVFTVGETDSNATSNPDIFLVRYDKLGNVIWSKQYGSDQEDIAYACEIASDTSVLVGGTYYVADSLQNKAYLAMIHIEDGSVIWEKTYGVEGNYRFNDFTLLSGDIKAVGERIKTGKTDHDVFNVIAHMDGVLTGTEEHYEGDDARYTACVQYQPGNFGKLFITTQRIDLAIPSSTYPEGEDVLINRHDSGLYWNFYGSGYSGVGQDQVNQMIRTSDGFAFVVGYHTTYGPGGNSVMLVKIGDDNYFPPATTNPPIYDIVNVEELTALKSLQVYPNPVGNELQIKLDGEAFSFVLVDATGKQVFSGEAFAHQSLDFAQQSSGIYYLNIRHASGEATTVKIVR